jgi:hypothetical protein
MTNQNIHTFHIPVMGLGYTLDTPIKIGHFGINSVVSIGDDDLIESFRKFYSEKYNFEYKEIKKTELNHRSNRITEYLNLSQKIIDLNFLRIKSLPFKKGNDLSKYFEMLPEGTSLKNEYQLMLNSTNLKDKTELQRKLREKMIKGSIDVNIMTKADNPNYTKNKEKLPYEFNDACASLIGYMKSNLNSSIVFSAGMNPKLFSYLYNFEDVKPDLNNIIRKKIILKVSDFRSASIQGKFLAKNGIWVSEFRIESGLNCGGHAFATNGELIGPILEEFLIKRETLQEELFCLYRNFYKKINQEIKTDSPSILFSAQGGVGTHEEHQYLLEKYNLHSIGWGTPFLMVPEAISIDSETIRLLAKTSEDDVYTSNVSPLGIPFNTLTKRFLEKNKKIEKNKRIEGSSCPKKFLSFNNEFTSNSLCEASTKFIKLKTTQIEKNETLSTSEKKIELEKINEKECLCCGLGNPSLKEKNITSKFNPKASIVCPGPNIAYFSKKLSLIQIIDHIYGRNNHLNNITRPSMFTKELLMYIELYNNTIANSEFLNKKQIEFQTNILKSIKYYISNFKENKTVLVEIFKSFKQLNINFNYSNT